MVPPGPHEGNYNSMPGPSRHPDYHAYQQPVRSSPPTSNAQIRGPALPPGGGWSSIHPGAANSNAMPPPPRSHGVSVKLEDLVSQNSPRSLVANANSSGPGGLTSVPLSVAQSQGAEAKATGGEASREQGPSEFIKKLYKMLEEESVIYGNGKMRGDAAQHGAVGWGKGGASFVVWEMNEFTTKVL